MKIGIAGGGIAGLTLMNFAAEQALDARLFEKKQELLEEGSGLLLGINAMKILGHLGLGEKIQSEAARLDSINITDGAGRILSHTDLKKLREEIGLPAVCIQRKNLHRILSGNLEKSRLVTGALIKGVSADNGQVNLLFENGKSESFDMVVGADGIHSAVRDSLFGPAPLRYSGYTCWRFITNLPEEAPASSAWEMLGRGKRFGICPVGDGKVYCYATMNAPEGKYKESISREDFARLFSEFTYIVPAILRNLLSDSSSNLIHRDISDLKRVYMASPEKNVLLAGDAGHATTPNLGQGAAMGIEDAWILAGLLSQDRNPGSIIRKYSALRAARVESIRNTSLWVGRINQMENPILRWLRNTLYRITPSGVSERSLVKLLLAYEKA